MVKVAVCRGAKLQCAEANIVQRLVVNAERFVGVLDKLVHRQGRIVGLKRRVASNTVET